MTDQGHARNLLGLGPAKPHQGPAGATVQNVAASMPQVDRRRPEHNAQSPIAVLHQMPAVVVLERLPRAVLAVDRDGGIVFVNTAFAQMLGYTREELVKLTFDQIFSALLPVDGSAVTAVRKNADHVVELLHADGSTVRARMSKSALVRDDDALAMMSFDDLTARLWTDGAS